MKRWLAVFAFAILALSFPRAASAHRLDEYLQATRIAIELDRIKAEMDLTPGAAVADDVFATISKSDSAAYVRGIMDSLTLEIDGQRQSFTLDSYSMPALADMRRGEGVIRLRITAVLPKVPEGRHHLRFVNAHRSDIGAYLVNALVPDDQRIRINGMSRDMLQREFDVEYSIAANERMDLAAVWPSLLGLALAAGFFVVLKFSGRAPY